MLSRLFSNDHNFIIKNVGQSFDVLGCSVGLVILGTVALKGINSDIYNDKTLSVEEDRGASILGRPDGEAVLGYQLSSLSWERLSCSSTLGLEEFDVGDNVLLLKQSLELALCSLPKGDIF